MSAANFSHLVCLYLRSDQTINCNQLCLWSIYNLINQKTFCPNFQYTCLKVGGILNKWPSYKWHTILWIIWALNNQLACHIQVWLSLHFTWWFLFHLLFIWKISWRYIVLQGHLKKKLYPQFLLINV